MKRKSFGWFFILLGFWLIPAGCGGLQKDGVYEANADGVYIRLELPADDPILQEFQSFRATILREIGQDVDTGLYSGYLYGRLTLENRGTTALEKGFSPPKILVTLAGRKGFESEPLQVMVDRLGKEADRMGRNVVLDRTPEGVWQHEFMNEHYRVELVGRDDPVGKCWFAIWDRFHRLGRKEIPPVTLAKLHIENRSDRELENPMNNPAYSLELESAEGQKAQSLILAQAIANLQKEIDTEQQRPEVSRNINLYNAYAILYNDGTSCLERAAGLRRDKILPGQRSDEYYVIYGIAPESVQTVRLRGGSMEGVSQALYHTIVEKIHFPLEPGKTTVLYMGFEPFDIQTELEAIHFTIGSLFVELK